MKLNLSQSQKECIEAAAANNGMLYRYGTGCWSKAMNELDKNGYPVWYFQHNTIKSLIDRKLFQPTNFTKAPGFRGEIYMTVALNENWESFVDTEGLA
jgi:hypothetical protein